MVHQRQRPAMVGRGELLRANSRAVRNGGSHPEAQACLKCPWGCCTPGPACGPLPVELLQDMRETGQVACRLDVPWRARTPGRSAAADDDADDDDYADD
eukprot:3555352-Alexandrium_andersonii.AAC.1